ncbi:hypothetical protein DL89DRAFT_14651 [Linderina pennispora]|uniref:Uncharacterized protein n=1 Tax=Linderina pennispora TaxID=61395 RepID=A0A1Y1WLH3_9FUNG|nr:uncharacterized protein DL89DRAFT_14651 [Linderina pennispora]ORX74353.1 hypothetical protein DL89DRAFT_14651 [Linderina pennispora]
MRYFASVALSLSSISVAFAAPLTAAEAAAQSNPNALLGGAVNTLGPITGAVGDTVSGLLFGTGSKSGSPLPPVEKPPVVNPPVSRPPGDYDTNHGGYNGGAPGGYSGHGPEGGEHGNGGYVAHGPEGGYNGHGPEGGDHGHGGYEGGDHGNGGYEGWRAWPRWLRGR